MLKARPAAGRADTSNPTISITNSFKACNQMVPWSPPTEDRQRPRSSECRAGSTILFADPQRILVVVFFILTASPHVGAQRIGGLSDQGFSRCNTSSMLFGGLCALVPLPGARPSCFRHKRGGRVIAGIATFWRCCSPAV